MTVKLSVLKLTFENRTIWHRKTTLSIHAIILPVSFINISLEMIQINPKITLDSVKRARTIHVMHMFESIHSNVRRVYTCVFVYTLEKAFWIHVFGLCLSIHLFRCPSAVSTHLNTIFARNITTRILIPIWKDKIAYSEFNVIQYDLCRRRKSKNVLK